MKQAFLQLIQRLRGGSDFEPSVSEDFTQTPSQREQRPLKANSQAWICARILLVGHEFTVQDIMKGLAANKIVSNEPGRRIREAIAWLKNEGIRVSFYLEGANPKHKRWYIAPAEANKAEYRTAMKKVGLSN